jgi:hypothetical protein
MLTFLVSQCMYVYVFTSLDCDGPACLYRLVSARAPRRCAVRRVGMVLTEVGLYGPPALDVDLKVFTFLRKMREWAQSNGTLDTVAPSAPCAGRVGSRRTGCERKSAHISPLRLHQSPPVHSCDVSFGQE